MPAWPGTLPQLVMTQGFQEAYPWGLLRTEMDAGPAKVRRRSTATPRPITAQIRCNGTQLAAFDAFVGTDLAGGALSFTWVDPRTQAAATFRFREAPTWTPSAGGQWWTVTLPLELLPS